MMLPRLKEQAGIGHRRAPTMGFLRASCVFYVLIAGALVGILASAAF